MIRVSLAHFPYLETAMGFGSLPASSNYCDCEEESFRTRIYADGAKLLVELFRLTAETTNGTR